VGERRYIVCLNEEQAKKDRADREAIVASLRAQLKRGDKSLVGNKGYRKYISSRGKVFEVDEAKIALEARYDGKWVLQTDRDEFSPEEVALKYKQLWMVEEMFRTTKSLLETRPIYHHWDETIRGHVFCSFLALVLRKELQDRLSTAGEHYEWLELLEDLASLESTEVSYKEKRFVLRSEVRGSCSAAFRAAGVAIPPTIRSTAD